MSGWTPHPQDGVGAGLGLVHAQVTVGSLILLYDPEVTVGWVFYLFIVCKVLNVKDQLKYKSL